MSDLISRQAAIDMIEKYFNGLPIAVHYDMIAMIHRLPSAKPERKNGKWRDHQEGDWIYAKCSLCGAVQDSRSNFCPNCGAEMEGGVCKGCHYNDGEVHAECVVCDKAEMEGEE